MKRSKLIFVILVGVLILAACNGAPEATPVVVEEEKPEATNTAVPPTAEPTATEEPAPAMLPVSMISALLGEGEFNQYKVELPNFMPMDFEESDLPALPGTVTANWFTSSGFYVVAYYGLDLEARGALCPGNSIMTGGTWLHISNAPTEEGACEGFPTLTNDPDVGPVDCHGTMFYRTAIPSDLQGTLYGTIEMLDEEGNLVGIPSQAESTTEMLEIDLAATCQ
ncbi:MAG: hypothetical protein HQ574_03160 [Chloroflexi bacterium]|nr:hypothetical protein [Chloroflexota bacterium]